MRSSFPQTRADFNPLYRPKGCINSYVSVVNTAKNGKLIRARLREIVLCYGLVSGFYQNRTRASLYYAEEHRVEQCTFLYAKSMLNPRTYPSMSEDLVRLPAAMYKTLQHYYKNNGTDFYDTKKFRIYRQRLEYGPADKTGYKKISLKRIIQYMATPLLSCMFALYAGHTLTKDGTFLDLNSLYCVRYAWDKKQTVYELQKYIDVVLKIPGLYITEDGHLQFDTQTAEQAFWNTVNQEASKLYQELKEGNYLDEREDDGSTAASREEKTHLKRRKQNKRRS